MKWTLVIAIVLFVGYSATAQWFPGSQRLCNMRPDAGRCTAAIPSFYYDGNSGTCRQFTYGGCGGNANRFRTLGECHSARSLCIRRGRK